MPRPATFARLFASALFALALSVSGFAGSAYAGSEPKEDGEGGGGLFNTAREVDLPMLVVPVGEGGRLHRYAYVGLQLEVMGADIWQVREKIPFIQDAFIREVYRASIAREDNPAEIDLDRLRTRLRDRAASILEDGTVRRVIVKQVAYAQN